jgi:hypothetical protein
MMKKSLLVAASVLALLWSNGSGADLLDDFHRKAQMQRMLDEQSRQLQQQMQQQLQQQQFELQNQMRQQQWQHQWDMERARPGCKWAYTLNGC